MINGSTGTLTILDAHTTVPKVFWNGIAVQGLLKLRVFDSAKDDEAGEVRLKVLKGLNTPELLTAMKNAGIMIKEAV